MAITPAGGAAHSVALFSKSVPLAAGSHDVISLGSGADTQFGVGHAAAHGAFPTAAAGHLPFTLDSGNSASFTAGRATLAGGSLAAEFVKATAVLPAAHPDTLIGGASHALEFVAPEKTAAHLGGAAWNLLDAAHEVVTLGAHTVIRIDGGTTTITIDNHMLKTHGPHKP